jgi:hypothetical protein
VPEVYARYVLIKNKSTGKDTLVDSILAGDSQVTELYQKSLGIFKSDIKRGYVEACLIASTDLAKIASIIEIPVPVLDNYRSIFFDISQFDKLSFLELIEEEESESIRGMKIWALSQGLDFIAWRLGKTINLNPVEGLQELFTLSVFKSKEALFSGNASEGSKEATKWTKLSMDLARLLKAWVMDSDAARKDIELALMSINPEFKGFDAL